MSQTLIIQHVTVTTPHNICT